MIQLANTAISTTPITTTTAAAIGYFSATIPSPTTNTSSVRLRIQFVNGSGLAFATARVPAFPKWELAASDPPSSATRPSTVGLASPRVATAMSAPPIGLIAVCTVSQTESSHGILSAKNSTIYITIAAAITMSLSNTLNCGGSDTQSNRLASPRMATVAYRLMPAANEKPIVRPRVVSTSTLPLYHIPRQHVP